jgi:hypothetical protein
MSDPAETLTAPVGGKPRAPELVDTSFAPEGEYAHVRLHASDHARLVEAVRLLERAQRHKSRKSLERRVLHGFDAAEPGDWADTARQAVDQAERELEDLARLRKALESIARSLAR